MALGAPKQAGEGRPETKQATQNRVIEQVAAQTAQDTVTVGYTGRDVMEAPIVNAPFVPETFNAQVTPTDDFMQNIPPELRAEVERQKNSIVFGDTSTIQKFGFEIASNSAKFTNDSTSLIKLGNAGSIGDKLNNMIKVTKSLDTSVLLSDKKPGFFGSLFGKAKDSIETFRNNQKSINEALEQIGRNLLTDRDNLMGENKKLSQMFVVNQKNIKMFDVIVAAGMIKQYEITNQVLPSLEQKARESGLPEDANQFRAGQNFLRQLEVRVSNMNTARSLAILTEPQLQDMQDSNNMQCENISTMITVGLPAWNQQLAMYISQLETRKSVEMTNTLGTNINETMRQNAILMGQNSSMITEAANRPLIELDTLVTIQNELFSTMDKNKAINEQGKIKRQELATKLLAMESDLKQKLLSN
jgi:uncharacterized protein YaaN involved in tellurite resistance